MREHAQKKLVELFEKDQRFDKSRYTHTHIHRHITHTTHTTARTHRERERTQTIVSSVLLSSLLPSSVSVCNDACYIPLFSLLTALFLSLPISCLCVSVSLLKLASPPLLRSQYTFVYLRCSRSFSIFSCLVFLFLQSCISHTNEQGRERTREFHETHIQDGVGYNVNQYGIPARSRRSGLWSGAITVEANTSPNNEKELIQRFASFNDNLRKRGEEERERGGDNGQRRRRRREGESGRALT